MVSTNNNGCSYVVFTVVLYLLHNYVCECDLRQHKNAAVQ